MTDRIDNFLTRRRLREESRELTQQLVLGFAVGFILLFVGAYKYFISFGAWDPLWKAAMWVGGASIIGTLLTPFIWRSPEAVLRRIGNWVGHGLINVVLTTVYFLVIWPVGSFIRATKGPHPIYQWDVMPSADMEGWRDKKLPYDLPATCPNAAAPRKRVGMLMVLVFFAKRGHIIFVPVLLLLVSLGIVLFFLQTSALAPFIYTLF